MTINEDSDLTQEEWSEKRLGTHIIGLIDKIRKKLNLKININ